MSSSEYESRLIQLIRADAWIMELLQAVRSLSLSQWCIAAGVIRNTVWDYLHDYTDRTEPSDIDLLFFDGERTDDSYQTDIEQQLSTLMPDVNWEAVNQATIHSYSGDMPYGSIEEAMSRWADQVTAVGSKCV